MAANRPVILLACSPSDLINYALQHPSADTTILICSTRSVFLESLASAVGDAPENELLHATLQQIASSRSIQLAFLPTLSHLRAYLAVFRPKSHDGPDAQTFTRSGTRTPLLLVYGLVNLHRDTSEWSAQGLGITIAALVENGLRNSIRIVMREEHVEGDGAVMAMGTPGDEEMDGVQRNERQETSKGDCWKEEMPMLNGSTRRLLTGADEGTEWAGRTVEVGRVLQRWCLFKQG